VPTSNDSSADTGRSRRAVERRPEPEPLEVRLRPVMLVGIAIWAVVLVVAVLTTASGAATGRLCAIAATGIALGGLGLLWERRRQRRR